MNSKIIKFYGKKKSRFFSSVMNGGQAVRAESYFEISYMYHLEFDSTVERWQSQPQRFEYQVNGRTRVYTPDFLIKLKSGSYQLVELKPKCFTQSDEFIEKHGLLNDMFLSRYHIPLLVRTEEDFFDDVRNENLRRLYRYKKYDFSRFDMEKAVAHLKRVSTVGELYQRCADFNVTSAFGPALVAQNYFTTNLYSPFSLKSEVEVAYA
ncbi:Tn7 transposase TnsA N-terminal domain-containing protein [Neptunicella sp. SCSIO 80796]|uniref:Tn7 transposase TnsA N-terminal domain-containing protein n=1 Tax=Neptunicella plasticusilytica TaxID=3117012 RepID=UPI003A4E6482